MCDTFVALPSATGDGAVVFGKNSDREPNEAQAVEFLPARTHPPGATVQCTYLTIPQASRTHAVLLSRPFWMWGAEMGANEKGVVIGNEAVFTRMPLNRRGPALTGMDMLRLALERAATADQAMETIVRLLADHGQGGACGYRDKRMAYHNSFLIADPNAGWVLETAGPMWAALKIKDVYAISNALTIGEAFDAHHPALIETARRRGWLQKRRTFDFAGCYSDRFYTFFAAGRRRRERALKLLRRSGSAVDAARAMDILRDHGSTGYRPDSHLLGRTLCAHAANPLTRNATQTAGSLVAHLAPGSATFWVTATAAPCTSLFKPLRFTSAPALAGGPPPEGGWDPACLWWRHEEMHRLILLDYAGRIDYIRHERDRIEAQWLRAVTAMQPQWDPELSRRAFETHYGMLDTWIDRLGGLPARRAGGRFYHRYWRTQNRRAGMKIN